MASEAVISAIFFISSSSAELLIYNAGREWLFLSDRAELLRGGALRFLLKP
jgi:hypothetical protein